MVYHLIDYYAAILNVFKEHLTKGKCIYVECKMPNTNTQYSINFVKMLHLHVKKIKRLYPMFNGLSLNSRINADFYCLLYTFYVFKFSTFNIYYI